MKKVVYDTQALDELILKEPLRYAWLADFRKEVEIDEPPDMDADISWMDESTESLWSLFGDEPLDDDECLINSFLDFGPGTHKEALWHWFDECHSKGVAYLLNPAQWEADRKLGYK